MWLCVFEKSGYVMIAEEEPLSPNGFKSVVKFDTYDDAQAAVALLNASKQEFRLERELAIQRGQTIDALVRRVDELIEKSEKSRDENEKLTARILEYENRNQEISSIEYDCKRRLSEIEKYFNRAKSEIALEIITHGTHRERDLFYKRQVLNMVTMQEVFIDTMEDIPF